MMLLKMAGANLVALLFLLTACGSDPSSPAANGIKISIKGINNSTSGLNKVSQPNDTTVTITSVRVVIDEIELESSIGDTLDFELEQPFVKDLMVGQAVQEIQTVAVPAGTYKELEIEIDELNPEDGAVYTNNPDLQGRSIYIEGYLNNDPQNTFSFASDLEEEQEQEFKPPIVLDENSPSTSVVLTIDMGTWFVDEAGNFIDPRLAQNQSAIEENIKNSIDVFEDKDDDDEDDDDDDDD